MKKMIRLTENDLHRIVKESVNRILTESKNSKRARQQAIVVARRTIRGTVPDPIIESYVREFEENYMQGCPDYLYKFLPKFVEIAFKSKTREEYQKVGEIVRRLVNMSRARWTLTNEKYRSEFEKINAARTAEDLETIYNTIFNSKEEPEDTWNRIDMYGKHNYVNDRGELRDDVWLDDNGLY